MIRTYIKKIPFPLGATVVGIVSVMFGIYLVVMSSLYLFERGNLVKEFCTNTTESEDANRLDVTIHHLCKYPNIVMYSVIAAVVDGCLIFICAVMLIIGVWKNSGTLLVPYLLLMGLQIFLVFAGSVALSVTLAKELMIRVILSAVFVLATPIYFWMVVFYHMLGTRHHYVADGPAPGLVVVAPSKVSNPSTSSTVNLFIEDEPTFPNTPTAPLRPLSPTKEESSAPSPELEPTPPPSDYQSPLKELILVKPPSPIAEVLSPDIENVLQPEIANPIADDPEEFQPVEPLVVDEKTGGNQAEVESSDPTEDTESGTQEEAEKAGNEEDSGVMTSPTPKDDEQQQENGDAEKSSEDTATTGGKEDKDVVENQ